MYLVIRGDRLYEGYSIVYTTKSGKKSTKGCIGKALGSKSELLAKDPLALEKLRAELKKRSAPNQATERTKQLLEEYIEEQIQARKDILEFRKEENFKHKEQNIELNKKALALRAYNQQILEEH